MIAPGFIELRDIDGRPLMVKSCEIASVSAHPGIHTNATVVLQSGVKHEVRDTYEQIVRLLGSPRT